jgi:hypothetical protein
MSTSIDNISIETNHEELDHPWAWLVRVPCLYITGLGNPFPGAELRVNMWLRNGPYDQGDDMASPILLSGFYPFLPLKESYTAESFGGYSLTPTEARALADALVRAADRCEVSADSRIPATHGQDDTQTEKV